MSSDSTPFATRCSILSEVWMSYRTDEVLEDFVTYNDLGLPLAFAIDSDLVAPTSQAEDMINETFDMLLEVFDLGDDGWEDIDHLLGVESMSVDDVHEPDEDEDEDYKEVELSEGVEYRQGYDSGFLAGAKAEQERVQAIAEMNMKWAKQSNKGNEFMQWHNVSEILKPVTIDPNFDDGEF